MRKDNSAIFECEKSKDRLHNWKMNPQTRRATCKYCKIELNQEMTKDCFES